MVQFGMKTVARCVPLCVVWCVVCTHFIVGCNICIPHRYTKSRIATGSTSSRTQDCQCVSSRQTKRSTTGAPGETATPRCAGDRRRAV